MEIAIFIFYLVLFSLLIISIPFFKKSGINKWVLIALFLIKLISGIAYARFYLLPQYVDGADTWRFYRLSLTETDWLLKNPLAFIRDLFSFGYAESGNVFSGENSYWNDLKSNVPVKIMAVINVITFKSYYANIIVFNFLFLFGLVGLFRVFKIIFNVNDWWLIVSIFLFPSTLFWCSGIHKDGLILSAIGIIIYLFHKGIQSGFTIKKGLIILACWLLIFALRNYIAFALLPALSGWYLSNKFPAKAFLINVLIYGFGIISFFLAPFILPSLNFPLYLAKKQHEFLLLDGGSQIHLPILEPTFYSYVRYFPKALDMAFFQPHISELKSLAFLPAVIENYILIILSLVFIVFVFINKKAPTAIWFFIYFTVSILFISGYTITISGAIVRYRSLIFPILITPFVGYLAGYRRQK